LLATLLVMPAHGQDTSTASNQPAAAPTPAPQGGGLPAWSIGPIDFSGAIDGYYTANFNHPASMNNGLYNFNDKANQFNLSLLKVAMSHDPAPVGFRLDLGWGRTMQLVHCCDPDGGFNQYVEQAFVSWKPKGGAGFQADFGKFNTSAGAEVIESYSNWNYSRSLAFVLALPYYHFGLRTAMPVGSHFTTGFQLVNGWNNVTDNNSGKTVGFTEAVSFSKFSWNTNIYYGPENTGTNSGKTSLIDTTLLLTPKSQLNMYLNYDYGQSRVPGPRGTAPFTAWQAFAGAVKFAPTSKWAFTPRGEWFQDRQGARTGSGIPTAVKEFTLTGEYKFVEGLMWRGEYRHDWSDQKIFERGPLTGFTGTQDTLTVAIIAFFGPPR
jgi:hypothetical protein